MERTTSLKNMSVASCVGRPDTASGVRSVRSAICDCTSVARVLLRSDEICVLLWHETLQGQSAGGIRCQEDTWYLLHGTWQLEADCARCVWREESLQCRYNSMLG